MPLELDRGAIKREASKLRARPAAINNLLVEKDENYPMKTTFG